MPLDFTNISTNQDLIIVGALWLVLRTFGVIDLVKDRITGRNGRYKASMGDKEARETSRQMIHEMHSNSITQNQRSEAAAIENTKQTEVLRSIDRTMLQLYEMGRNRPNTRERG